MRRDDDRLRRLERISRKAKPRLEGLEDRLLLYATTGGAWSQPERITFSFVPDGTNVGGLSSSLNATLNAEHPGWQTVFQQAAAVWEQVANVNLVLVGDNGVAIDSGSYQQGDPNNGDIRISAVPLGSGTLASTFLPPPLNGGPDAGDMIFNSSTNWTTGSQGYDLLTVAIHEFGHALGMGHSAVTTADMYAYYNAVKSYLTTDDISGIQSIYGTRQPDAWTAAFHNTSFASAADITSQVGSNGQAILTNLDITAYNTSNWFKFTVPATTTGSMTIVMQSTGLSELSPRYQLFNAAGSALYTTAAAGPYGATVGVTATGVSPGQVYYVKTGTTAASATGAGNYALELNFGSGTLPTVAPPNTTVANQPDAGGGSSSETVSPTNSRLSEIEQALGPAFGSSGFGFGHGIGSGQGLFGDLITVGTLTGHGDNMTASPRIVRAHAHPTGPAKVPVHHRPHHHR